MMSANCDFEPHTKNAADPDSCREQPAAARNATGNRATAPSPAASRSADHLLRRRRRRRLRRRPDQHPEQPPGPQRHRRPDGRRGDVHAAAAANGHGHAALAQAAQPRVPVPANGLVKQPP